MRLPTLPPPLHEIPMTLLYSSKLEGEHPADRLKRNRVSAQKPKHKIASERWREKGAGESFLFFK